MRSYLGIATPLLIGHRGSRTLYAENTLEAIEEAARAGAHGVEVDVRPCASGELVVAHDPSLERVTRGVDRRAVADLGLADLRAATLPGGERIPRLIEVIELCVERGLLLNVEVKRDVPSRLAATRAAARALAAHADRLALVISSFDPFMLGGLRVLCPTIPAALLIEPDHVYLAPAATAFRAVAIHIHRGLVTRARIGAWHARGHAVVAWTVNDVSEARRLLDQSCDGIITDDPASLAPAISRVQGFKGLRDRGFPLDPQNLRPLNP